MKTGGPLIGGKGEHQCRPSISGQMLGRASHFFYLLFNWTCTIVFAYQGYLWIRHGGWTKIPTRLLLPGGVTGWPFFEASHGVGSLLRWCCNVDLIYTLGVIAMMFYAVEWFLARRDRQRLGRFPSLSGEATQRANGPDMPRPPSA